MTSRILFPALAAATLSFLTACGGGDAREDNVATPPSASALDATGGIGGSGVTTQALPGNGTASPSTGGIGGSGSPAPNIGGIGGSGSPAPNIGGIGGSGIESVALGQACGLQSVHVTIAGARVNADAAADLGSAGWVDVAVPTPLRVDLLKLAAGEPLPLDFAALPDGTYGQIRLLLVAGDAAAPLADSVVAADGQESALAVPGAAQGGLALASTITVAQGQVSASLRGLDVCRAISGAAGSYSINTVSSAASRAASTY